MTAMGDEIRFGLLGSLEVTAAGQPITLPGRRVRALLALLVLRANQAVSTERIISGLWGLEPPKAARESVHYFVHQLRKALPHDEGDRQGMLERHGGGYLLRVPPERIDVVCFQRGVEAAGAARGRGEWQPAWELYTEALGWWRGPALDDLAEVPFAAAEIARLTELRLVASEHQFAVGLELGWHDRLVSELDAQVRSNPDREELRWLLMLALYRSRRQAEALEVYQGARTRLAGRGEPGMRLQQLQRAILTQDPTLDLHPLEGLEGSVALGLPDAAMRLDAAPPATPAPPPATPAPPPAPPAADRRRTRPRQDERKLVTALVVGVVAAEEAAPAGDPEDVRAHTAEVMDRIAGRIRHYGGMVETSTMGQLLAVFGADLSREDDPERAVRAALELVGAAEEQDQPGLAVRGGVATGEVVVTFSPDGPSQVIGDVVQLAVTLEQGARPGTVVVGASTYQATSRTVSYTPVQPRGALERASGMVLWQANAPRGRTGAQATGTPETPLIERDRELGILGDVLTQFLRHRQPQSLTLVSDPGLGKSRLVAELAHLVDQAPDLVTWRVGHTRIYGQGALGALAEIVAAEVGILGGDDAATAKRKLNQTLTEVGLDSDTKLAEALQALLGTRGDEERPVWRDQPLDDWTRFLAAVADLRPLVVVFEDLQWADDHLAEFVEQLPERVEGAPVLVVTTGRPELLDRRPGWSGGQRNAITITLSPLTREGTEGLLAAMLGGKELPERTRAALLDAAGGNPLYVEEYVHMLAGRSGVAVPDPERLSMPTSVQQVIAARIDALPPEDKRLLQDAAVVGASSWAGQLAAVGGTSREEALSGLRRLQRREFLRRVRVSSVEGEVEFAFRHALIREVAYGQLLRSDRADKHQRAAAWFESINPDVGERAELLAHHYGRALELARSAGRPTHALAEQARKASRAVGDRAMRLGSSVAAARAYRVAMDLGPLDDPERPELLLWMGYSLVLSEGGGQEYLEQARVGAVAAGRLDLADEADAHLGLLARINRDTEARDQVQRRLTDLARDDSAEPNLHGLGNLALELILTDSHAHALATSRKLVALARRHQRGDHEGYGLLNAGQARLLSGDPDGAAEIKQGVELMDEHRFPPRFVARYSAARTLWWYGDVEGCAAWVADGLRRASSVDTAIEPWFRGMQTALYYADGQLDHAMATADRALAEDPKLPPRVPAECLIFRGAAKLALGQADDALADARAAARLLFSDDTRYRQIALALEARCLLASGARDQAAAGLEELLADQRKHPAASGVTPDQAELLLELGYPADALPEDLPPTRWHQAVRALAARDFRHAAELLDAIGSKVDAAAARARLDSSDD